MPDSGRRYTLEVRGEAPSVTLAPMGDLDLTSADGLVEAVERASAEGTRDLVLDLRDVEFLDSSGLRAILMTDDHCRRQGVRLRLIRGSERVMRVFTVTRVGERLPFIDGSG